MTEIIVRLASDKHDFDAARTLCLEWLDWHWKNYPDGWPRDDDHPMNPQRFKVALEALPVLYKRPLGGGPDCIGRWRTSWMRDVWRS